MSAPSEQLSVLVVDDDDIQRVMSCEALEQTGFTVLEANDGIPALEIFENTHIDLVILDVMMLELDGFETCRRIRRFDKGRHTPILMMTGLEDVESIDHAYRVGATDFVTKPINLQVLPRRLRYMHRATQTAAELRDSTRRLENAQRMANLSHWEWNRETQLFICSAETESLLGVRNGAKVTLEDFLKYVHPSDKASVNEALQIGLNNEESFENTFRVVVDETIRFLHQDVEFFTEGTHRGLRATLQDVTKLRNAQQQAHRSTYYDELTSLPNRLLLTQELERALYAGKKNHRQIALLAIDLDEFKRVNDSLGHSAGDEVLRKVSDILKASVRTANQLVSKSDHAELKDIVVSRMGGDEFVIVLNDIRSVEDAAPVARRIQKSLAQTINIDGREIVLSCSIGISGFPNDCKDAETLLKNAVSAMNHAKAAGRDKYQFYDASMNARAFERLSMEANLRKALDENQFELYFQPKIDIGSGSVIGAEALIRWIHPDLGIISPIEFIPVAEETGLVLPIGEWIITSAANAVSSWQTNGLPDMKVAINVSAAQFATQNLPHLIATAVSHANIPSASIEIEITESLLMQDLDTVLSQLKALKEQNINIWIDDFGTGYSSLSYLKQLPISGLKIDQSFVREMASNNNDLAIVTTVIGLARNLNLGVVAEGVEEHEQLRLLATKNCDIAQGFYYSRPLPNHEFQTWVATSSGRFSRVSSVG
ncbi:MAG: EAL domain-containing protein [Pseudomonadota bacterium]